MPITLHDATEADLPAILAIHNEAILTGTALWVSRPVDLDDRRAFVAARRAAGYPFLVAREGAEFAGYASFGDFRSGDCYGRTVEHSVYVAGAMRGRGVAKLLLSALFEAARARGKAVMVAAIGSENAVSIRLHEAFGFVETGRMPGVGEKFGRLLDLVLMQKAL